MPAFRYRAAQHITSPPAGNGFVSEFRRLCAILESVVFGTPSLFDHGRVPNRLRVLLESVAQHRSGDKFAV